MFNRKCDERRGWTGGRRPRLKERECKGEAIDRESVSEISPLSQLLHHSGADRKMVVDNHAHTSSTSTYSNRCVAGTLIPCWRPITSSLSFRAAFVSVYVCTHVSKFLRFYMHIFCPILLSPLQPLQNIRI